MATKISGAGQCKAVEVGSKTQECNDHDLFSLSVFQLKSFFLGKTFSVEHVHFFSVFCEAKLKTCTVKLHSKITTDFSHTKITKQSPIFKSIFLSLLLR